MGIKLSGKSRQDQISTLDQILSAGPGTSNNPTAPKKTPTQTGGVDRPTKEHPGIKKGWLRKALKTDTFERLGEDEQAVIRWMLDGHAPLGHWLEQFTHNADEEMGTLE